MIRDLEERHPVHAGNAHELRARLRETHSVTDIPVVEDLWQRVNSEEDRQAAERKTGSLAG